MVGWATIVLSSLCISVLGYFLSNVVEAGHLYARVEELFFGILLLFVDQYVF